MRELIQYVRNKHGHPIGILYCAGEYNKEIVVGWSLCSKRDKFNKQLGLTIAKNRIVCYREMRIPDSILGPLKSFVKRAEKYFNVTFDAFVDHN